MLNVSFNKIANWLFTFLREKIATYYEKRQGKSQKNACWEKPWFSDVKKKLLQRNLSIRRDFTMECSRLNRNSLGPIPKKNYLLIRQCLRRNKRVSALYTLKV